MGTNLAPILANIYMATLKGELYSICKNKNIIWPEMYKRFIDDGSGVIKSNTKEFSKWDFEFKSLHGNICIDKWHFGNKVAFMDLYIQGKSFFQHMKIK